MTPTILVKLIEHNNWANLQIVDACAGLNDAQLDFQPNFAVQGTIREILHHFVTSEEDYVSMLTTLEHPPERELSLTNKELRELVVMSGRELISFVQNSPDSQIQAQLHLTDGYKVDPWVIITQVINHATEHREQIKSVLTALGIEPPRIDGWMYGRQCQALISPGS